MTPSGILLAAIIGVVLGSFATALSWRLPRGIPICSSARSRCPACGHTLSVLDLVPLLSWVCLRGKCRHCQEPIGLRYPVIEAATLALSLAFYAAYGLRPEALPILALAPVLVAMIDIDLRYKILPDALNLSVLITGVVTLACGAAVAARGADFASTAVVGALTGVVLYGGGAWLLRQAGGFFLKREALGLGDVKFYAAAGFWLGLNVDAAIIFLIASGLSGVLFATVWKKISGEAEVPFGPALIIAFVMAVCLTPTGLLPY